MKAVPLIVKVDTPCSENWQNMLPNEKGSYCSHCSKTVIDFTKLSDAEIVKIIQAKSGHLCGRLSDGQLERPLLPIESNRKSHFYRLFTGLLFINASSQVLANSNSFQIKNPIEVGRNNDSTKSVTPSEVMSVMDSTKKRVLRGVVMSADGKTALPNAIVTIANTKLKTTTDDKGEFSLKLPKRLDSDSISLLIERDGFSDGNIRISRSNLSLKQSVYLLHSKVYTVGRLSVYKPKRWWQFWK